MESRCSVARVGGDGKQTTCGTFVTEPLCPWMWWRHKPAHVTELQRRKRAHTSTNETGAPDPQVGHSNPNTLIPMLYYRVLQSITVGRCLVKGVRELSLH